MPTPPPFTELDARTQRGPLSGDGLVNKVNVAPSETTRCKPPVSHERRAHGWSAAEVARLYAAAHDTDPDLALLLAFMLNTGVRKGAGTPVRAFPSYRTGPVRARPGARTFARPSHRALHAPLARAFGAREKRRGPLTDADPGQTRDE